MVNGEGNVVPYYLTNLDELFEFYWPWRASGRTLTRNGRWDEEASVFWRDLFRLDANIEYYVRIKTKAKLAANSAAAEKKFTDALTSEQTLNDEIPDFDRLG